MIRPLDVGCPTCGSSPGQRCGRDSHWRRVKAAESANRARAEGGSLVQVDATIHPAIPNLRVARYRCPSCGQRHWAVWDTDRLDGDLVPHRSPCRIARHLRPAQVWLKVRSMNQLTKPPKKSEEKSA